MGDTVDLLGRAGEQRDARSISREAQGDLPPDTAAGARDERHPPLQLRAHLAIASSAASISAGSERVV